VRLLYGSTPLEDMINYNVIVRNLTEWTATAGNTLDQTSISEGIGGSISGVASTTAYSLKNIRQSYIQGNNQITGFLTPNQAGGLLSGTTSSVRRYQVQFALGLFTQGKLIPTKFMASQLAVEITLASESACIIESGGFTAAPSTGPALSTASTYQVTNINLIPEILEFDASYDASFIRGLREGGVPIKFSSWHTFQFATSQTLNLLIQERSRSVKALFAVMRHSSPAVVTGDSGACVFFPTASQTLNQYQYRIGGRYFPASPVQCSTTPGSTVSNGGAEAFCELQKALNTVGDYRLSSAVNTMRWATTFSNAVYPAGSLTVPSPSESDYLFGVTGFDVNGNAVVASTKTATVRGSGEIGSQCFAMAVSLETSNGLEISGLNAEEQSDISLQAIYSAAPPAGYLMEVYTYYDAMLVLRENNVLELIQ